MSRPVKCVRSAIPVDHSDGLIALYSLGSGMIRETGFGCLRPSIVRKQNPAVPDAKMSYHMIPFVAIRSPLMG